MRVRDEIIEICRARIEPGWKRRVRELLRPYHAWRAGTHEAGEGVQFARHAGVRGARLGRFSSFGPGTVFSGPVVIGDLTMLSSEVLVIGQDHVFADAALPMRANFPVEPRPVTVIEADCWIGARAIIMEGVRIGRGSIVGAGSVVARSIPPYSIVVGAPGRVIRSRFSEPEQSRHDTLLYDGLSDEPFADESSEHRDEAMSEFVASHAKR